MTVSTFARKNFCVSASAILWGNLSTRMLYSNAGLVGTSSITSCIVRWILRATLLDRSRSNLRPICTKCQNILQEEEKKKKTKIITVGFFSQHKVLYKHAEARRNIHTAC